MATAALARLVPKAELHVHLDGSLLPSFLFERAAARDCRELLPLTTEELRAMVDDMKREMRRTGSGGHKNIGPAQNWPVFDLMNKFLQTPDELFEASRRLALYLFHGHNVRYLEVRFCPSLHTLENLSEKDACAAVTRGLRSAFEQTQGQMRGGVILCALRSHPGPHALLVAQLAKELLEVDGGGRGGVLGFDVAGSEQSHYSLDSAAVGEGLRYCKDNAVPITVHAGELPSGCVGNLLTALHEDSGIRRIGHGAALARGDDNTPSEELCKMAVDRGVTVEVCLTAISTAGKGFKKMTDHPIKLLMERGIKVCVGIDNLLLSGDPVTASNLDETTIECAKEMDAATSASSIDTKFSYSNPNGEVANLVDVMGFTWEEVAKVTRNGFDAMFAVGGGLEEWKAGVLRELDESVRVVRAAIEEVPP
jgi:adenosine deaminase